jgi:hypothetical protein
LNNHFEFYNLAIMTKRSNTKRKSPSRKPHLSHTRRDTRFDEVTTLTDVIDTAIIPVLRVQTVANYVFRYTFNSQDPILSSTAWTTQMFLNEFAMSMGSGTARRIFNAIRLKRVEIWTDDGTLGLEFSPAVVAGYAGAPRIPRVSSTLQIGKNKNNHLVSYPRRDELAHQWFTSQQASYTLFNADVPSNSILEFEFDAVFWNGEGSPYATSYSSNSASGTLGTGNFSGSGITGMRNQGWSWLATP